MVFVICIYDTAIDTLRSSIYNVGVGHVPAALLFCIRILCVKHTTSQLGAQHTPNAWIMNLTFILMGFSSILAGWDYFQGYWFHRICLLVFGISLILVAYFHHAPIDALTPFNKHQDDLHSLFATTTGISFILLAICTAFSSDRKNAYDPCVVHCHSCLFILYTDISFSATGRYLATIAFVISFGWLLYEWSRKDL